jgi:DNA-binding CsgD family transcriptional regulator
VVAATLALPGPPGSPDYAELHRWVRRTGLATELGDVELFSATVPTPWRLGIDGNWRAAAAAWQVLDVPYERALELMDAVELQPVLQAITILDRLGARPAAELAQARARRLGAEKIPRRPIDRKLTNPQGLSERQLDVLALIADGLTNTEIGAELYLSTRTVDHHVSAILNKLGVSNWKDAARAANDLK